ncbi:MAG: DinB family protein [Ignavibacteriales bacterium]|nr:DinB family protein [Ignavibacteriales bacterium]
MDKEIILLLHLLDEGYERKAWHGPNLRGSIRGLTFKEAARRPGPRRHNIWEIVVHCAYWKYAVRRRISGEKRGSFPLKGSNWIERPVQKTEAAWQADINLLQETHIALREAVEELSTKDLDAIPRGSTVPTRAVVSGIAFHDVYHAGQIQLLKKIVK